MAHITFESMKKNTLILHIGTAKTGTTSIQDFLTLNRPKLKEAGVLYATSFGPAKLVAFTEGEPWTFAKPKFGIDSTEKQDNFRSHLEQKFRDELNDDGCRQAIISNELLHARISNPEQIRSLKTMLDKYFLSIKVIVYFRRQDLMAVSRYSTALIAGYLPSGHFNNPDKHYYDFFAIYQKWANCFGTENVKARIFSKEHFINGNLIDDFCAVANIPENCGLVIPERKNEAFSLDLECLVFELNLRLKEGELNMTPATKGKLIETLRKQFKGSVRYPSRQSAMNFHQLFAPSNTALQKQLGAAMPPLFNDDFSMYPEREDIGLLQERRLWAKKALDDVLATHYEKSE